MQCAEKTFLQSWNWGEFWQKIGKIWRLGIYDGDTLLGIALIAKIRARRGTFLLIQHGPVLKNSDSKILQVFLGELKWIAKEERVSFIRMNPLLKQTEENDALLKNLGFRLASMHANAYDATWKLDLVLPEDGLFGSMRKTTRYLIKRMEKEGVKINVENPPAGEEFLRLQDKVAERKHFIVFSKKQIKNEIEIFNPDAQLEVFNAMYDNKIIASALIIFYGYRAFYYQSASYTEHKNISAPYLLVWRAILEAKKRDCKVFDFYGASPADKPNHPWAGPTLFKLGFGSERIDYLPAQDLVLSAKYWITYFIEIFRRIKRGF